jgi:hypothetical protein
MVRAPLPALPLVRRRRCLRSHDRGPTPRYRVQAITVPAGMRRMSWQPENSGAISASAPADCLPSRQLPKASSRSRRSLTSSVVQQAKSEAPSGCGLRWCQSSALPGSCQSPTSSSGGASPLPSCLIQALAGQLPQRRAHRVGRLVTAGSGALADRAAFQGDDPSVEAGPVASMRMAQRP